MNILLVGDEPAVAEALGSALESQPDHSVHWAGGDEALSFENFPAPDLLITEVVMEPVDGFTLSRKLRAKFPAMRTVFVSEYDLSQYSNLLNGDEVLHKPLRPNALAAAIEKHAEGGRTAAAPPAEVAGSVITDDSAEAGAPDEAATGGQTIGGYRIVKRIGDGKWGTTTRRSGFRQSGL